MSPWNLVATVGSGPSQLANRDLDQTKPTAFAAAKADRTGWQFVELYSPNQSAVDEFLLDSLDAGGRGS
jgi:hypothetical protein